MEALRQWKIVGSLTAIFIAGAVTGSVITFQVVKSIVRARSNPDQWSTRVMREYRHHLQLTPEQVDQIKPRMMEAHRQMKMTRSDLMQEHGQIYRQLHMEIMQVLTPEQRDAFRRLREKKMARFRERNQSPNLRNSPAWRENMQRERWREQQGEMHSTPRRMNDINEKNGLPKLNDKMPADRTKE